MAYRGGCRACQSLSARAIRRDNTYQHRAACVSPRRAAHGRPPPARPGITGCGGTWKLGVVTGTLFTYQWRAGGTGHPPHFQRLSGRRDRRGRRQNALYLQDVTMPPERRPDRCCRIRHRTRSRRGASDIDRGKRHRRAGAKPALPERRHGVSRPGPGRGSPVRRRGHGYVSVMKTLAVGRLFMGSGWRDGGRYRIPARYLGQCRWIWAGPPVDDG